MRPPYFIFFLFLLFFTLFLISPVFPQASVNVSTLDPVYRDIDKLVAHGLIDRIIVGQRPYSRKEIARLTAEAMKNLHRLEGKSEQLEYLQPIFTRLKQNYHEELVQLGAIEGEKRQYSLHAIEYLELDALVTNSPQERLLASGIDAIINPLVDYREGRHLVQGDNLALETTHWLRASDYFAMYVRPRFQLGLGFEEQNNDNTIRIMNLYGKFYFHNFEIEVGRDNLVWGQGEQAGILLSQNPRGLDLIKISNDSPFYLPWVFKYLGPVKFSFFYSDLGPKQNFPDAYLAGYKLSFEFTSFFELGAALYDQSGGQGSPSASFGERVGDLFPVSHIFLGTQANEIGNKMFGGDLRFRIPPLRGIELYSEFMFDDIHEVPSTLFLSDGAYVAGLYLPRLTSSGGLDLRLEYHYIGYTVYTHGQYTSGLTLNQFILGDNLGPQGQGGYLTLNWDLDFRNLLTFHSAFEKRDIDVYGSTSSTQVIYKKVVDNPAEFRYRGNLEWLHRPKGLPFLLKAQAGYEYVQNFNWVQGRNQNNFLGEVFLQFNLDRWAHFPKLGPQNHL